MSNLTDFIQNELYPALFGKVREAFPEMEFKPYKGGWASRYKLNGDTAHTERAEKSVITSKVPTRVIEQGGESKDLVTFYMEQNSKTTIEAVKELSGICGLVLPEAGDFKQWEAYKAKQEKLERINETMKRALFSEEGAGTLKYLKEERGYSEDFIKWAEFGFIGMAPKEIKELEEALTYTDKNGTRRSSLPYGVGGSYTLTIPYRTNGAVKGFVFRSILPDEAIKGLGIPKYKDAFISGSATKAYNLFGLAGRTLANSGIRPNDIIIVEGEIDALRASFAGVENVVAASGGNISQEALKAVIDKGAQSITIVFDTEGGEGQEQTRKRQRENYQKAAKAVSTIHAAGLSSYVCYLNADTENQKQDVDSFLKTHSGEELKTAIAEAETGAKFLYRLLVEEAHRKAEEHGGTLTDKDLQQYKKAVISLCNEPFVSPVDRDQIFAFFSMSTNEVITKESIQEEADLLKQAKDKDRQQQEAISLFAEAFRKANEGDTEGAISAVADRLPDLRRISKESQYSKLLALPTAEEILKGFKTRVTGIETEYYFRNSKKESTPFILPSGALTYICALTTHGKSRMLENLALQLATREEEGDILYFTFEEDAISVQLQLLNIYANMEFSKNNLRTLSSYYKTGDNSYFGGGALSLSPIAREQARQRRETILKEKEKAFFSLLTSGKLRIFHEDYDSSELIEAIRYTTKQIKVKAVFIDYIQLLRKRGSSLQRKDELKDICKAFMALAVDTGLPIVMASQLNRETYSPIEMQVQNISEASDIEHSANVVMLLWNSSVKPVAPKSSYFVKKGGFLQPSDDALKLEGRNGWEIGKAGKLYAVLAKNRGGERGIDAVFDFDGNTGYIEPNFEEEIYIPKIPKTPKSTKSKNKTEIIDEREIKEDEDEEEAGKL